MTSAPGTGASANDSFDQDLPSSTSSTGFEGSLSKNLPRSPLDDTPTGSSPPTPSTSFSVEQLSSLGVSTRTASQAFFSATTRDDVFRTPPSLERPVSPFSQPPPPPPRAPSPLTRILPSIAPTSNLGPNDKERVPTFTESSSLRGDDIFGPEPPPPSNSSSINRTRTNGADAFARVPTPEQLNSRRPSSPFFRTREDATSSPTPPSPRQGQGEFAGPNSRSGSLSAPGPAERNANRRSGFYGSIPKIPLDSSSSCGEESDQGGRRSPSVGFKGNGHGNGNGNGTVQESDETDFAISPVTPPAISTSTSTTGGANLPFFIGELHHSVSFYDPDTLLFLDHVTSETPEPIPTTKVNGVEVLSDEQFIRDDGLREAELSEKDGERARGELLSTGGQLTPVGEGSEGLVEDLGRARPPKTDLSRKVRESIRLSKAESTGAGMSMDVELVEMLLGELDGTKKEMKDLQSKYNAFRRASRSAFEGFSMAREEYDKEVFARREAETKMDQLRLKLTEQALTLAAVDREQKTAEALKRQSTDLRSSVIGMERQLSQLKAEMELSTAQVEELAQLGTEVDTKVEDNNRSSSSANHAAIALSLNDRLESVKAEHRQEIEDLVRERDDLTREVDELRKTRDSIASESAVLLARNADLVDLNAEAARQLESARTATTSSLRAPSPQPPSFNRLPHQSASSITSTNASFGTRSPLSSSRGGKSMPEPPDADHAQAAVVKKFKWGKGKIEQPRTAAVPPRSSGSTDAATRTHVFQQTSILRPVRCEYCGDKMWGLNEVRCASCGCYTHAKCAGYLVTPCSNQPTSLLNHQEEPPITANGMFGNDLIAQAKSEERLVPLVVLKCIAAVEANGMNYEGIYRKTGGMGQTKLITQFFERGDEFDLEDSDKFNDLAAVTSCLKNFFRSLPDPLFTHDLHEKFVACVELSDPEARLQALRKTLYQLPDVHFHTAKVLLAHLHRVHLHSSENKMTPSNLGVVFGPTVLRSIEPSREFSDMGFKAKVVELMVEQYPRLLEGDQ